MLWGFGWLWSKLHTFIYVKDGEIFAYTRFLEEKFEMAFLGRVITSQEAHGTGLGIEMIN